MSKQQLADKAGVSLNTLNRCCLLPGCLGLAHTLPVLLDCTANCFLVRGVHPMFKISFDLVVYFIFFDSTTDSLQPETPSHSQSSESLGLQNTFARTPSFLQAFRQQC